MVDTRYRQHNELVNKVLLFLGENYSGRFWGNATGALETKTGHFQRYGLKGSADILGISGDGLFVAIEVKTGEASLSPSQRDFKSMIDKFNGVHIVVYNEINIADFNKLKGKL